MQNPYFGSKIKIPKNMLKSILQIIYTCAVQKNQSKKHQIFEKYDHLKNRQSCKGYSPCKILTLGHKLKFQKKHVKMHSKNHLQFFPAKSRSKKHEIFEKYHHFKNRPSCTGYSPWKILLLGQNLKFQKTCQSPLSKLLTVVLCKKPLQKIPNIREMTPF